MSKEKLEDIKTATWNICECETCFCDNFTPNMVAVEPEHFDWLIEQAKLYDEMRQDAYKQNNRYREAIQKAMKLNIDENYNYDVDKVLHESMEGEEE